MAEVRGFAAPKDVREGSGNEEAHSIAASVSASSSSAHRPAEVKRFKTSAAADRGSQRAVQSLADFVQGVRMALSAASERKIALAGLALEIRLVALPEPGVDKRRRVCNLLQRTQQLQSFSGGAGHASQAQPTSLPSSSDDDEGNA